MNKKMTSEYLAELIMDVIPKTMQSIREEMRSVRGNRLTIAQFRVLAAINRGIAHNKEIGERLGVSEAAISRMIDILVLDKLIKKGISKKDRRQSTLTLTLEGQELYNLIKSDARYNLKNKFEALSTKDREQVILGFEILQKNSSLLER